MRMISLLLMLFVGMGYAEIPVIPRPQTVHEQKGSYVVQDSMTVKSDMSLNPYLIDAFRECAGLKLLCTNASPDLMLSKDAAFEKIGSYKLVIEPDGMVLSAKDRSGMIYGMQTLLQLITDRQLQHPNDPVELRAMIITDAPRFEWRGMHLDVSRHFYPADYIKDYIDFLVQHKMNVFHWHLTDDQGWRIEINAYPKLTKVAAWRKGTGQQDWNYEIEAAEPGEPRYGGFYTQEEVREIVDYAQQRGVTIVPEIEMPGHSWAALYAYPELSCSGEPWVKPDSVVFEFSDPFCAGNEQTFEFLETVLDEVINLFPSEFIHIGGDEAKKSPWEHCRKCQKRMQEKGLDNVHELQSWFIRRIQKFVNSRGRRMIGWDEILQGGLAPGAAVMSWRGFAGGLQAARAGHDVVMAPSQFVYLNRVQGDPQFEPFGSRPALDVKTVYGFDPIPAELSGDAQDHILGGQGCLWTEHIPDTARLEYMLFPRLLALSEALWTQPDSKSYDHFYPRMARRLLALSGQGVNFRRPVPGGLPERVLFKSDTSVTLVNPLKTLGAQVHYTLDGEKPDVDSPVYSETVRLTDSAVLKARLRFPDGSFSNTIRALFHKIDPAVNGLMCEYYAGGPWVQLPDFAGLNPLRTERVQEIGPDAVAHRDDQYALRFTGELTIAHDDTLTFYTSSDDGSHLIINGKTIVMNDGVHGTVTKTGRVYLTAGRHDLCVEFFDAQYGQVLEVGTLTNNGENLPLSPSNLYFKEQ
ncbi:MAG: family 20 glycosylhydrolase [candidate division KSB1 bacterium]|nr:family 20 glycosylhydrolase [candidate division KSB1 bacterium]